VFDALKERGLLLRNAPHLIKKKLFVIPCYSLFEKIKYFVGLKLYDWLAGPLSFGSSKYVSRKKLLEVFPNLNDNNLQGGVTYFDGQFDDARLAMSLAQTAVENGGVVLNYCKVVSLKKENGKLAGLTTIDVEEEKEYFIKTKAIINATGVFVDAILKMDERDKRNLVRPSQGVHIVVDKSFLRGDNSLLIPKTPDGRVLFTVPWMGHLLIGTTDTPLQQHTLEPKALESEVNFIVETVARYLKKAPQKKDILTVFAGLRPLAASQNDNDKKTKEISRDHKIIVNSSGLITITGGKWTTYRKMAVDAIEVAIKNNLLPSSSSKTTKLHLHGFTATNDETHLAVYGSDAEKIKALWKEHECTKEKLVASMPYTKAEAVWCIQKEMARTVEDILARRLRILFLNAKAAMEAAPVVAEILQNELNKSEEWKQKQLKDFTELAKAYLL
jgi:glycerol-3-phosphate dehydrogenase